MLNRMQTQRDGRVTTSCTECQRRKQKCSREWPCNHCQARKVAHLCQFGAKRTYEESPTESICETPSDVRGMNRNLQTQESFDSSAPSSSQSEEPEDGLKAWGYMPGHVHYKIGTLEDGISRRSSSSCAASSNEIDKVLHAIPRRSITDAIVKYFLKVTNYQYSAIYGPTLTNRYVEWWNDRNKGKRLSPEFTCLLLRICAYSVQCDPPALRSIVELELACDSQALTERFASAAEQLSQSFEPSNMCIERVQEQILKGAWLKSESKIVESWHVLGCTIRAAQELGIDKDVNTKALSEFDIEIRRRIWTLIYVWDWQMSTWLGRPNLIDQKNFTLNFPTLRLDQSTTEPNLLSPFAHISLQAQLGRRMTNVLGDAPSTSDLSAEQVFAVEVEWDKFLEELPPIFRVGSPDTSLDEEHPYFILQRYQLHCVIYMTMLGFLKPYLTMNRDNNTAFRSESRDDELRRKGVDVALRVLEIVRDFSNSESFTNIKSQLMLFSIFDTATTLCSAIIHDIDYILPRRNEIMDAIESSLEMLYQLSPTSKLGATSYNFIYKLLQAKPELRQLSFHKRRNLSSPPVPTSSPPKTIPMVESTAPPTNRMPNLATGEEDDPQISEKDSLFLMLPTGDLSFDPNQFWAQNPFENFGNQATHDMDGMEQIWDWGNINVDGRSDPGTRQ